MSAIFGIVNLDGAPVAREHLAAMNAALAHHGAAGSCWLDGSVGLGQRLMCFTPEDRRERQPLVSADGQCVLVSDGRIDNRRDLIAELSEGRSWPGAGKREAEIADGELILAAYERWGQESVHHLVGAYAFAAWDRREQALFAARSPICAPALVYHVTPRLFAFATMPSGLHALPSVPRTLDEAGLVDVLVGMSPRPETTVYQGISRLLSGQRLRVDREGVQTERYWRPDLAREIRFSRDQEYLDAFDELFTRVVGEQLRSLTPIAIQMSGGLDSSSVAVTAARLLAPRGERLAAFTEVPHAGFEITLPPAWYADETPYVQAIAGMCSNLDLDLVHTDGQTFLQDLALLYDHLEMPVSGPANRVWIEAILRKASGRGMLVLLDGTVGNHTMSWGGVGLVSGLVRAGRWMAALRQARALARNGFAPSTLSALCALGLLPLLPDPIWLAVDRLRHPSAHLAQGWLARSPIHPDFARTQRAAERMRAREVAARTPSGTNCRRWRLAQIGKEDAGAYLSAYRAMFGVDMRTPPGDVRLAEFCLALPEEQYLSDGEPRRLIRSAMAGRLPAEVLANRQRGLQAADWLERLGGARDQVAIELDSLERCDLAQQTLDLARLRQMFQRMPRSTLQARQGASEYHSVFMRGLAVGRFLRWFDATG